MWAAHLSRGEGSLVSLTATQDPLQKRKKNAVVVVCVVDRAGQGQDYYNKALNKCQVGGRRGIGCGRITIFSWPSILVVLLLSVPRRKPEFVHVNMQKWYSDYLFE